MTIEDLDAFIQEAAKLLCGLDMQANLSVVRHAHRVDGAWWTITANCCDRDQLNRFWRVSEAETFEKAATAMRESLLAEIASLRDGLARFADNVKL